MKPKTIITILLLLFVVGSIAYMFIREAGSNPVPENPQPEAAQPQTGRQIRVYYFHGDYRCPTCQKLEGYAKEALETGFSDQLASGFIQWMPVNTDQKDNEHFIAEYQLVTKSVILSDIVDGKEARWKNLDLIWDLVKDKPAYLEYIQQNLQQFIGEDRP